jgi:hypothetical protein
MRTALRLGLFALGLVAIFAVSFGAGWTVGPTTTPEADHEMTSDHADPGSGEHGAEHLPGGLQVAEDGYRLELLSSSLSTAAAEPLRLRILGPDGSPVTAYTPTHDKDLHLIVVRRDLTGFRHVHPQLGPDGVWEIPMLVAAAGQYRVFADFQPAGRDDPLTLGADLPASGDYQPAPLPAPSRTATVDDYTVTLDGDLVPGTSSMLTLTVVRHGTPVTDLQPYLAAYGHLVALRDGDLAYLHVHPDGHPGDGRTSPGPQIVFHIEVPTAGAYRLFLDFQHEGVVRTVAFTALAGNAGGTAQPSAAQEGEHE